MYEPSILTFALIFLIKTAELKISKDFGHETVPSRIRDAGEPLFLTPLIESGKIDIARRAAEVPGDAFLNVKSFSGLLTVDKRFDSNLFFWFFPAEEDYENAPVLLWLQGGPGATSMYALFNENGPFLLKKSNKLIPNRYSWTKNHSVIYIDNPVQTGFSFTKGGFAKNETKVGEDLYQALYQFYKLFPELLKNEFYATGESYAGKYVPAISYTILKKNQEADLKINLKGMSIGNGLCDPEQQMIYSDYLYQIGLLDSNGKELFAEQEQKGIQYIRNKEFKKAFEVFDGLMNGDFNGGETLFHKLTGYSYYFNYLYPNGPDTDQGDVFQFMEQKYVREAIHVGNLTFYGGEEAESNLLEDVMDSVTPWISELLSNIRVVFYNGQLDIIVGYPLTVNFLKHLKFNGSEEYKSATRNIWYDGNEIAGYVKEAGNLTEVLVRNAGHMVPEEQPSWILQIITKFTRNRPIWKT